MKYYFLFFAFSFLIVRSTAQEITINDSKYREDQFYTGVTYNFFGHKPMGLSQSGFSLGVHGGFIRDMPINRKRNIAIGLGLGLSFSGFNSNVSIIEEKGEYLLSFVDRKVVSYSVNRFSVNMVELPLEFRWRTSTANEFKFWRIYTGFKLGYVFNNSSKFKREENPVKLRNINKFNDFQYGVHFTAGYNTWNFYFYHSLNPIFKDDTKLISGNEFQVSALKVGLLFFIL